MAETGQTLESPIEKEMQSSYLDYAMSVIIGRALPDARDGLKPAHRRILYAMYRLNNVHDQPTKKSARIVGEVLGKYHPHGDIAAYDTLIRMAQTFSMNHTLVQGQGNMGCFTKDTEVRLLDGRRLSFEKLVQEQATGKRHWTFAFNTDTNSIEITEIKNPRMTRKKAELVEVTLDNDEKIKCTPNHKFLQRDGTYVQAKDLKPGNSLMPLYTKLYDGAEDKNLRDYEIVRQPLTNEWQFVHHLSDKWNIVEGIYAKSRGRIRHHIDFNKNNNNPDNILRMSWREHWKTHYELASWRHKNDPEYVKKLDEGRKRFIANNHALFSERLAERNRKNWKNPIYRTKQTRRLKAQWEDSEYKSKMAASSRNNLRNLWKTEKFQKLMSEQKSNELRARWKDDEYRAKQTARTKMLSIKIWGTPGHRERISKIEKVIMSDPTRIEKQSKVSKALWKDPAYRAKFGEGHFSKMGKKAWENEANREMYRKKALKQWQDPAFAATVSIYMHEINLKRMQENPNRMKELAASAAVALRKNWKDPSYKKRVMKSKILHFTSVLLSKYTNITPEIYESERKNNCIPRVGGILKYFSNFDQLVQEARTYNHKIVNVVFLSERQDVYDITTYPYHNFALASGIFVHNSIDGDPPAAARYTEVRLDRLAEEMLADLDKKCVPFVPNFDNTEEEPVVLPAKVPNLLLNGSSGIAVGVATNILPHNLREVCDAINAYVDNHNITPQELLQFVKGPDFPTGGTVFYDNALHSSYITGKGACTIRGRTEIEEGKSKDSIIIREIPYMVNKAQLVQKIAELVKGRKIQGISDLRDESGKEGVRVVIELRKDANADAVLNTLYMHTQLQTTLHVANIAILKTSLLTLNLKQFIKIFVDHRLEVIKARTKYDLDVATDRLHIVEGLLVAIANINDVVSTIKKSSDTKEARVNLMGGYGLSEKQANAILDMKLSKLTSLESGALGSEKDSLLTNISSYNGILANESRVFQIVKEETSEIKAKYGRPRRTLIESNVDLGEIESEDTIVDEETTVILTNSGYMKRMPTSIYKSQGRGGKGVIAIELREGDFVKQILSCMSKDYLLLLTNKGRAYWLKAWQVPEANRYSVGKAAVNLVKLSEGETVETMVNTRAFANQFLIFVTKRGTIKRVKAERFSRPRTNGIMAIPLRQDDSLADACISDGKSQVLIATRNGKALRFAEADVRPVGRIAHGVRGIRLSGNDAVVNLLSASESDVIATVTENGFGKLTEIKEYRLQRRGGKGVINLKVKEKTGRVVKSLKTSTASDVILISSNGLSIQFPISTVRMTGRSASGVRLMRVDKGTRVVDAQLVND